MCLVSRRYIILDRFCTCHLAYAFASCQIALVVARNLQNEYMYMSCLGELLCGDYFSVHLEIDSAFAYQSGGE